MGTADIHPAVSGGENPAGDVADDATVTRAPAFADRVRGLPLVGESLPGRFELQRELGHGGSGVVFAGRDHKVGREVAIKLLRQEVLDTAGCERLRREIRAGGAGQPNLVAVYDLFDDPERGLTFLALEPVDGQTLREVLRSPSKLPLGEAVQSGKQVTDALEHLHAQQLVHREVKTGQHGKAALSVPGSGRDTASSVRRTHSCGSASSLAALKVIQWPTGETVKDAEKRPLRRNCTMPVNGGVDMVLRKLLPTVVLVIVAASAGAQQEDAMQSSDFVVMSHMSGTLALQVAAISSAWFQPAAEGTDAKLRIVSPALSEAKTLVAADAEAMWRVLRVRSDEFVLVSHMGGTLAIPRGQIRTAYFAEDTGTPRLRLMYDGDPNGKTIDGSEAVDLWQQIQP